MSRFDPRSKLILVAAVSSMGVYINDLLLLTILTLLGILTAKFMGANLLKALRKLRSLMGMLIFIAVMQSVFNRSGTVLLELYDIPLVTSAGIIEGVQFLLRMLIIIISATIITTSSSREVIQGLVQLKIPYEIAFLVSLGIRFLPMLTEEIKDSFTAIKLRGVVFKNLSLKKKLNICSYLFLPVIAGTIKKAEKIALSMETKGFRVKETRSSYLVLKYSTGDYFLIILSILMLFAFIYAQNIINGGTA